MRRWWSLLLVGVLAYGLFLGLRLPIGWWFERIPPPLPAALSIARLDGNLLHGSASGVRWNGVALGRLDWRFAPGELLGARLGYQLSLHGGDHRLNGLATLTPTGTTRLDDLSGELPLALVAELSAQPLLLDGRLALDMDQLLLSADGRPQRIAGQIRLTEARLRPLPDQPLGPFRALFEPPIETGIAAVLDDQGGPLALNARLQLRPDGVYRIEGRLQARPDSPPQLGNLLAALGSEGAFDLSGRWF